MDEVRLVNLNMKFFVFIFFLIPANKLFAHLPEEGRITATLGPYVYRTDVTYSHAQYDVPFRGSAGLIVEGDIDKNGGLEIAMFYINKMYFLRQGPEQHVESIKRMYLTTGYRHWFTDKTSAALGFASSYSMGEAISIYSTTPASKTLVTSAGTITEYAIDLSLQRELWSFGRSAIVLDARYSISLNEKKDEDADVYGLLLGFKYDVQGEPKKNVSK